MYSIKFNILYDVDATTTGTRINVDIGNFQSSGISFMGIIPVTSSTVLINYLQHAAYIGNNSSSTTPTTPENCSRIEGMIRAPNTGVVRLVAGHEAVAGATMIIKKGSMVHYQQLT